jgi:hypothetical protein
MTTHLANHAAVEHADNVAMLDRLNAMAHHDHRSFALELAQGVGQERLVKSVLKAGRLVEHQDRRRGQKRARDGDALALPAR